MKPNMPGRSGIVALRLIVAGSCLALSAFVGFLAFAADPSGATIGPSGPTVTWAGTAPGTPPTGGAEDACEEGTNCDSFTLTISGTPADWAAAVKVVHVQIDWTS